MRREYRLLAERLWRERNRCGRGQRQADHLRLVNRRADHQHRGGGLQGANPGVDYKVDGPGTGDGFALFCKGQTDISDASRKIKDEEAAACKAAGIHYVELKVGIDGISVITSQGNSGVTCLSFLDLYALLARSPRASRSGPMPTACRPSSPVRWTRQSTASRTRPTPMRRWT